LSAEQYFPLNWELYRNLVVKGASSTLVSSGRRADGAIFIIKQEGQQELLLKTAQDELYLLVYNG
jgi:hypothetical protein